MLIIGITNIGLYLNVFGRDDKPEQIETDGGFVCTEETNYNVISKYE